MLSSYVKKGNPIRAKDMALIQRAVDNAGREPAVRFTTAKTALAGGWGSGLVCAAENAGVATVQPFSPAIIVGQSYTDSPEGKREVILTTRRPVENDDMTFLVIALQQILPGTVGRVCIQGICWMAADATEGLYASPIADSDVVTLAETGPIQVLHGSGTALVLGRFATGSGSQGGNLANAHYHGDIYIGLDVGWGGSYY
jgi:hypothetical protein